MPLLRPRPDRPLRVPEYRTVSCPFNGHQVGWCRALCTPVAGRGSCGRVAGHAIVGRTQAILAAWSVAPAAPSR